MAENASTMASDEWLRRYESSQLFRTADSGQPESEPYLGIHSVIVYVRDVDVSLAFYVGKLGFQVVIDQPLDADTRWVAVAPPDGSVLLALQRPDSDAGPGVGNRTVVTLETEDIEARFQQWSERGVHFQQPPTRFPWGVFASFQDADGNELALIQGPWLANLLIGHRRSLAAQREAERRAAHEMDIARQVQARLLPQRRPSLESIQYAGACTQARQVGGDYYDFLDLGHGRLAFVVGDISGKGIGGALLMANLQASLRSQYALALEDLPALLASVNRLLCENTSETSYATLIYAEYEERARRLRYVNCGHLPGLLLHQDGTLDRLESTATVLGLFCNWECAVAEVAVSPGDVLALYTDGATEALSDDGHEFGEQGLVDAIRAERSLPVESVVERTIDHITSFSGSEQEDDITLVLARFD